MEDSSINNLFKSLKTKIEKSEFDSALELLEKYKKKFDPGVYYYNRATIFALKEELVQARIDYELAMRNGYVSPELKKSLQKVKSHLQVEDSERPEGMVDQFNSLIVSAPSEMFYTLLFLMITGIIFGFKKTKNLYKAIACIVIILPFLAGYQHYKNTKIVIIKKDQIVREGPSKIFAETQVLPKGIKILIGREYSNFVQIIYPVTYSGWIEKSDFYILRK